jgi:hypothetical protein
MTVIYLLEYCCFRASSTDRVISGEAPLHAMKPKRKLVLLSSKKGIEETVLSLGDVREKKQKQKQTPNWLINEY